MNPTQKLRRWQNLFYCSAGAHPPCIPLTAGAAPCRVHPAYALGDWGTYVARRRTVPDPMSRRIRDAVLEIERDRLDALYCIVFALARVIDYTNRAADEVT